jgi:transcriptional regulator with XRE-family HTH domain
MATTVRRLIEKAAKSLGSDTRVAERLGVSRQRLWDWKSGLREMPMDRLEHLATLAGEKPEKAIALVAVERYHLGKRLANIALLAAALVSLPDNSSATPLDTLHIMRNRKFGRFFARWLYLRVTAPAYRWV